MTAVWQQWEGRVVDGEFHLRQYLGGSDHSAVFLTECADPGPQKAAIKLIPADPAIAELQLRRWGLAANLSHPHLIRLFQMGHCSLDNVELLYAVMEYAEEDLSQILPNRPLTPAEARDMLRPALDALAYLHGKGLVHGHMKPSNMMAIDDQLKLSSDGLCAVGEVSARGDRPNVYGAPEAASGGSLPAGDVWSLGMTLVETLTQHVPGWERTNQKEPALPETMPPPFLDIARHCLRRDPQLRWTVADIAGRLQPASRVPQPQTRARPENASPKWRYIVPTAAIGLALLVILAWSRLFNPHSEPQRTTAVAFDQPTHQSRPERRPETSETGQSTERAGDKQLESRKAASSPVAVRSEVRTKTRTAGIVHGEVAHQSLPDVPNNARDTIRGIVRVAIRVQVDASGNVVGTSIDSPGPSKYFANLANQAAQRWTFTPAKVDGQDVSSEWILRFGFARAATKVIPVEAAP
jgi:TonB family protein